MGRKKRKIGFYYLILSVNANNVEIKDVLNPLLAHISKLNKVDKKKNISEKKFGLLDSINSNRHRTNHKLLFKSATHSFRPPLIDKTTVLERVNPKTINEGETQKTHLIIRYINGEAIVALEKYGAGMSIKQLVEYLNHFASQIDDDGNFRFAFETILKDDFLEEVNELSRVVSADIFVEKQILGGDALNFSERINTVQHEVVVSVKAKRQDSIKDFTRDIYAVFNGGAQSVNKIRLIGRNNENNIVSVNTDLIERQEYVTTSSDDNTGEIITNELFVELETVLHNYN